MNPEKFLGQQKKTRFRLSCWGDDLDTCVQKCVSFFGRLVVLDFFLFKVIVGDFFVWFVGVGFVFVGDVFLSKNGLIKGL